MSQKQIIISISFILFLLTSFILLDYFKKKEPVQKSISPYILSLTQPIKTFTGIVEKKEANSILVQSTSSTNLKYTFTINENTSFLRPPATIPFLFATPIPVREKKYQLNDIVVGSIVTVATNSDLRLSQMSVIEAKNIFLPSAVNMFTGTISDIKDNLITISMEKNKKIGVTITTQTEISRYVFTPPIENQPPQPIRLEKNTLADLKKGMQLTVYTDQDIVTGKNITALRIEPIIQP